MDIQGFRGALSSTAQIDRLSVSDAAGVWVTLEDVTLQWNRSQLLSGRIEIGELSAARVLLPRLPVADDSIDLPTPEARPFSLPELPVAVNIGQMRIDRVEIGAPVLGEAAALSLSGAAALEGGEGTAQLNAERLDRPGRFDVSGTFDNGTRNLVLDLVLSEAPDGLAANLLGLPGRPSVNLTVDGNGPLGAFGADLRLSTDGEERLSGRIETATEQTADGARRQLRVDIGGDITPVFLPAYRSFFGPDIRLNALAEQRPNGVMRLDRFELVARNMALSGTAELAADGWPVLLDIDGAIRRSDSEPVLLPLGGAETRVDTVTLAIKHDANRGEDWSMAFGIDGLDRDGITADTLSVAAEGRILRGAGLAAEGFKGEVALSALALDFTNEDLAQAVGAALLGSFDIDWQQGAPVDLRNLRLSGQDYGLTGNVSLSTAGESPEITLETALSAQNLSRFAALAGRPDLAGAAALDVDGNVRPLSAGFDLSFDGTVTDLVTGIAQIDPLLEGGGTLRARADRDETGTRLSDLDIATDHARITGQADLSSSQVDADIVLAIAEAGRALPGVEGPLTLAVAAQGMTPSWRVTATADAPGDAALRFNGTLQGDGSTSLTADGTLSGRIGTLETYAALANRPALRGALTLDLNGAGDVLAQTGDLTGRLTGTGLRTGIDAADKVIAPDADIQLAVARDAEGTVNVTRLEIDASNLAGTLSGTYAADGAVLLRHDIALRDAAPFVTGLRGALGASGTVTGQSGDRYRLETRLSAPGQADLTLAGEMTADLATRLNVTGTVAQLSAYRAVAGMQGLSGGAAITAALEAQLKTLSGNVSAQISGRGLRSGIETLDLLVGGGPALDLAARRSDTGRIDIDRFDLNGSNLTAGLSGALDGSTVDLGFDARVANVAPLVPGLQGAASAQGSVTRSGGPFQVQAGLDGPGGSTARVAGSVTADGQRFDLGLSGAAPLALANRQLRPRVLTGLADFDLRVDGPPALSSVSGTITTSDARLSLPTLREALTGIAARVTIGAGRAQLSVSGDVSSGGRISVTGPVGLSAPFPTDLAVDLDRLRIVRDRLVDTSLDGTLSLRGDLTGAPFLGGQLTLGPTELRVPEGGGLSFAGLPGLEHRNLPANVAVTMRRAGIGIGGEDSANGADGGGLPLDVTVTAPQRIFVRGRGLDAELGGQVRVTGTTADPVPQGQFTLIRGHLALLGRRLTLDEGAVQLRGALDPEIRFAASATVEEVALSLLLSGELSQPELTLSSSPELPDEEILSLFLFGRNATQISALQLVRLAAAVRTLSGRGGGLTDGIREGLGVDTLDLNTAEDGTTEATVGSYLSDNIYTDVTVDSAGESEINLNLTIRPGVVVRGRANNRGETGIGIFIEKDY